MSENLTDKSFGSSIMSSLLALLAFLVPIFFLPTTVNFFDPNKLLLVIIVTLIGMIVWAGSMVKQKHVRFTVTPFTAPIMLFGLVALLSTLFSQPNMVQAFMGRGLLIPLLALLFLVTTSLINNRGAVLTVLYGLVAGGVVLSLIAIFQTLGGSVSTLFNSVFGTNLPTTLAFSPAGSPLALITYLLPVFLMTLLLAFTLREGLTKVVLFLISAVMVGALVITVFFSFPGKETAPVLLPYRVGYSIALQTFQQSAKTALLGWGPEAYVNAFTRVRPGATNLTDVWNLRFTTGSNELFTVATTLGLLGLTAWLFMVFMVGKYFVKRTTNNNLKIIKLVTGLAILLQLLLPANMLLIILTYLMLILWSLELKVQSSRSVRDVTLEFMDTKRLRPDEDYSPTGETAKPTMTISYIFAGAIMAIVAGLSFVTYKAYGAEATYKLSLDAARENKGTETYDLQRAAITKNPRVASYHRTYANTNLALANAIASRTELSDQDRENVARLIQQAIREAKAAVSLDPTSAANWESLATVYRSLINVAQNAEQLTIASYVQAIQTDPVNPRLRLELGGVYFRLGQTDQAIRLFQQASELKPNWANAYFNLAAVYKEKGELENALANMQRVVQYLEADSADMAIAQEEINSIREALNLETQESTVEGELSEPEPLPSPLAEPVELPEESGPETTPAPSPVTGQ